MSLPYSFMEANGQTNDMWGKNRTNGKSRLLQAAAAGLAGLGMLVGAMGSTAYADSPVNPDNPPQNASALAQSEKERSYFLILGGGTIEFYTNGQENSILSIPLEIYHGLKSLGIDDDHIKLFFYRSPFMRQCEDVVAVYIEAFEPELYRTRGIRRGDLSKTTQLESKFENLVKAACLPDVGDPYSGILGRWKDGGFDISDNLLAGVQIGIDDYLDDEATKANLEKEFKKLPAGARVIAVHSGHGDKYGYAVGLGVGLMSADINEYLQGVPIESMTWVHKSSWAQIFTDGIDIGNKKMVRIAATNRENGGNGFFPRYLIESLRKNRNHTNASLWNAIREMTTLDSLAPEGWPFTTYSGGASPNDFFLWDPYPVKFYLPFVTSSYSAGW